jgi:hypothetical protein
VLALPGALPFGLITSGAGSTSEVLADFDPVMAVLSVVLFAGVVAPIFGYVFLALPFACVPLAVLSFTYVARSLRRDYRGERLSATGWSRDVIGPITALPTALSLFPIRMTRWTAFWTGLYLLGWVPGRALLRAAYPAGIGYLVTVIWMLWPLHSVGAIIAWALVSAAIGVFVGVLVVRAARQRVRGVGFRPRGDAGQERS